VLTADLGVHQIVLISSKHEADPERLAWRKIATLRFLDTRDEADEMDDFIEPNGPDWGVEPEANLSSQVPRQISNDAINITADHAWLYESLCREEQTGSTSIDDVIQHFGRLMNRETPVLETNA
jgi:RNA polymerase I-specific transcription initiation factor RRN6